MEENNWEPEKMLDVYIHDYFVKRKLHESAKAFMEEVKVGTYPVAIDSPGGFLFEWWSIFWDIFIARTNEKHSELAAAYLEGQQNKAKEHQQQLQMQQLQMMQQRNAQLMRRGPNQPPIGGPVSAMNSEDLLWQPPDSALALKFYEEQLKLQQSLDSETANAVMLGNKPGLLKALANHQSQPPQENSGSMSAAFQQLQARYRIVNDMKPDVNFNGDRRPLHADPSSLVQSQSRLGVAGINQEVSNLPLKGWPLTMQGMDQKQPTLGTQLQKPNNVQNHAELLLASQQQQITALTQAQDNQRNSSKFGNMDPCRFGGLPRGTLSATDGQSARNDESFCSPMQLSSPKGNKKRKQKTSSGPANSTGTENTAGRTPNSPSSTGTLGDRMTIAPNNDSVPKSMMTFSRGDTAGLLSSYSFLDDTDSLEDVDSLDDNVELFLTNDGEAVRRDDVNANKYSLPKCKKDSLGYSLAEVRSIRTQNSKVTCCHFSSDGKLLANAGHDKKVVIWNIDTLQTVSSQEEHQSVITDIRFRIDSSQLATASYDKSVRLWDAANPNYCMQAYTTHNSPIMSLDFHPNKTDLFCFCDSKSELHYWTTSPFSCSRISKGASAHLRFQPRTGQYLAAASENIVSIIDVESDRQMFKFQEHKNMVKTLCWDLNGEYLASVSDNVVKIFSLVSGECIHELGSNGNQFHSCTFHPNNSNLLVIGGISSMELWNISENRSMTIPAHENVISALAQSPVTGMVASASYDGSAKIWK